MLSKAAAEIMAEEDARILSVLDQLSFGPSLFVFDRCEWIINGYRQDGDEAQTCVEAPVEWLEYDGYRKSLCKMHSQRFRGLYNSNLFKILTRTEAMMKNALE